MKKIFRKTSKLSRDIFWACWDHVVAQKSIFRKKKSESFINIEPPFSYLRDITHVAKRRGGLHEIVTFSKFYPKSRFLSDFRKKLIS